MTLPKPRLLVPATFCITTFLAMGCNLPDIDLDTNGDEDEDEDEDAEDTEGETDTDDEPGISGGGVDSEGGEDPTATTEPWGESGGVDSEGFETDSGYDTDTGGGGNAGAGCVAYCEVELACDQYYASVEECQAACAQEVASAGECAPEYDALNQCLGTLGCEELGAFWVALEEIYNTGETGPFPCDQPFMEFALCGSGGSGGSGGTGGA